MKTFLVTVRLGVLPNSPIISQVQYALRDEQIQKIVAESRNMFEVSKDHTLFCAQLCMDIWGSYCGHAPRFDDEDVVSSPDAVVAAVIAQNHQTCWQLRIQKPCTALLFPDIGDMRVTPTIENVEVRCECKLT